MGTGFGGDLSKLQQLAENLRRLAGVPSRMSRTAAVGIAVKIKEQFESGTDPYGNAWAPLAQSTLDQTPNRRGGPLVNTAAMSEGVVVVPMRGAGISIKFTVKGDIAAIHQSGTSRMPSRKVLPEYGMPASWEEVLRRAGEEAFGDEFTGKK